MKDLPGGDEGQDIDIRFSYDLNGVLEVEATVVATNQKTQFVITSNTRGLTQEEIDASIERLHQLKPTPREQARWTALLKRAEREYAEAADRHRPILNELMDLFETALLDNDKQMIEKYARHLEFFLDHINFPADNGDDVEDNGGESDDEDEGFDIGNGGYDDGYSGDQDHGDDWKRR